MAKKEAHTFDYVSFFMHGSFLLGRTHHIMGEEGECNLVIKLASAISKFISKAEKDHMRQI
jgi:hypothetical protein